MPPRRRRRRSINLDLRRLALTGGIGLAFAFLALYATVSSSALGRVAELVGARPPGLLVERLNLYATSERDIPDQFRPSARDVADRAPLSADPFFFAALNHSNELDKRIDLLEEARRRNPRHRLARFMLLESYVRQRRLADATQEMIVLTRLLPENSDLLVGQIAQLAMNPDTSATARAAIGSGLMLDKVLEEMARAGASPDLILALSRGRTGDANSALGWQYRVVDTLVTRGQEARAYRLWRAFNALTEGTSRGMIYDADFRGLPGSAPFNWSLASNDTGAVEPLRRGGIEVSYFGRRSGDLASQLLLLEPGRYRLRFRAEGNASGRGSSLVWRVICRGAERALVESPMRDINHVPRSFNVDFEVPREGCPAQWLHLTGQSAEFPTPQNATLSALSLAGLGRRP